MSMTEAQKIGRYEIIAEKGRGAMGAVYLARDPAMDRIVALKTIHSIALTGPKANEFRERFYREARSAGGLAHPGIVTMFDVGEQDGTPYLVMEYIEGRTLAEATKNGQRYTFERVCEIGQQIAEALGYAHKNGVVHRDIKPANILMTSREKYGVERPKITDFGVAKLGDAQLTTTGQILGTPAFMPPEQFTGAPIDGRSDLFSLGVILYWLATGEHAFPGESVTAVSYKIVHTNPVSLRALNPAVPAGFDQIVLKCLAKSPNDRYATGEDLARDLVAVRAGRTSTELQTSVPFTVGAAAHDNVNATVDPAAIAVGASAIGPETGVSKKSHPPATAHRTKRTAHQHAPGQNKNSLYKALAAVGALLLVMILAAGWYGFTHRQRVESFLTPEAAPETVPE
ncbi:MAG: serine/threonine protein kinase, partial [Acidobacteriota bacterium]|nr:serine/threonine protein kinase [Acidobacteriota bacterium]